MLKVVGVSGLRGSTRGWRRSADATKGVNNPENDELGHAGGAA